jgi:hypothetical protein
VGRAGKALEGPNWKEAFPNIGRGVSVCSGSFMAAQYAGKNCMFQPRISGLNQNPNGLFSSLRRFFVASDGKIW